MHNGSVQYQIYVPLSTGTEDILMQYNYNLSKEALLTSRQLSPVFQLEKYNQKSLSFMFLCKLSSLWSISLNSTTIYIRSQKFL